MCSLISYQFGADVSLSCTVCPFSDSASQLDLRGNDHFQQPVSSVRGRRLLQRRKVTHDSVQRGE